MGHRAIENRQHPIHNDQRVEEQREVFVDILGFWALHHGSDRTNVSLVGYPIIFQYRDVPDHGHACHAQRAEKLEVDERMAAVCLKRLVHEHQPREGELHGQHDRWAHCCWAPEDAPDHNPRPQEREGLPGGVGGLVAVGEPGHAQPRRDVHHGPLAHRDANEEDGGDQEQEADVHTPAQEEMRGVFAGNVIVQENPAILAGIKLCEAAKHHRV
mmetsp:Transcript_63216/g.179785  ORF Transcript_63216/g.179785 Transcript_63216/m.179785 type:complete len:214 (-) Transcript_63216:770-1411(-)